MVYRSSVLPGTPKGPGRHLLCEGRIRNPLKQRLTSLLAFIAHFLQLSVDPLQTFTWCDRERQLP